MNLAPSSLAGRARSLQAILLVEDDEGLAELFRQPLLGTGLRLDWVRTGQEALHRVAAQPDCLLLLDYSLPDMKAAALIESLAQAGPVPPFIVITGQGDESVAVNMMKLGALDYLLKDTRILDRLPRVVERVLEEIQVRQQLAESERKRLQNEKELSIIYNQTPLAMLLLDSECRLHKANPAAAVLMAKPVEQALTLTLGEAFSCQHAAAASQGCGSSPACGVCTFRRCVQDSLATGQPHRQVEAQFTGAPSKQAADRFYLLSTVGLEIENRPYVLACLDDITQRKQAEEKIRTQAELLDLTLDAIHVADLQGRMRFWNKGAETLYGWSAAEVLAGAARDFQAADPASCRESTLRTGRWSGELEKQTRGGRKVVVQSQWTLLKGAAGTPQAILVVDTDITEKKQVEVQLLRAQRLENVGRLAGGIAHDLNNILAPILMSIPLLRDGIQHRETLAIIDTIEASAQRGASIVKQVLTFGRSGGGPKAPLQAVYLIKEMGRIIQETFPKSINCQVQSPPHLGLVLGDPTQLHQVLMNLCVNARDAMPQGGKLTLTAENVWLDDLFTGTFGQGRPGGYVLITVTDTGAGIPAEHLDKIFDPFFTTKSADQGTGLGLATVLGIVRSYNGVIQVDTQVGRGTQVKVFLPIMESLPASPPLPEPAAQRPGRGELILVVDDEDSICNVTQKVLQANGYRVLIGRDGTEGVSLYVSHQSEVQVVLTDLMMPFMNGTAMVRALQKINPLVKVIMASGMMPDSLADEAKRLGVVSFLSKPYNAAALLKMVQEILQRPVSPAGKNP